MHDTRKNDVTQAYKRMGKKSGINYNVVEQAQSKTEQNLRPYMGIICGIEPQMLRKQVKSLQEFFFIIHETHT